jgi:hypothetical protein
MRLFPINLRWSNDRNLSNRQIGFKAMLFAAKCAVESLERRVMLTTDVWNGATADWNTPGDCVECNDIGYTCGRDIGDTFKRNRQTLV